MNLKKLALAALAAVGMASMPVRANAQFDRGTIETVAAMLLAEKLGLDPQMVSGLIGGGGGLGGGSLFDMAPALALQRQAPNRSLEDIIDLRNEGLGWDAVATRSGVSPAAYSRLRNSGQMDNNALWRNTVVNELNLPSSTVSQLRNMGFSWRDIVSATLVSRESGRPLSEVAYRYRSDRDWNGVASRYGVTRQEIGNRVSSWRSRRSMPANWARNSTRWTPPGLAKKGGLPPGLTRRTRTTTRRWNDDHRRWNDDRDGRRAMPLRSKSKGHGKGKWKNKPGKHGGHGKGHGRGKH
ncbi:MAG: hypothetical protein ACO1SV_00565 [Fimbriimonas sp.]